MAARTPARQWLERQQELLYRRLGELAEREARLQKNWVGTADIKVADQMADRMAPSASPEEHERLRQRILDSAAKAYQGLDLPTRLEDPRQYALLVGLAKGIEEAAQDLSFSIPIRPLLGTLPTGRVNAMAIAVPSSNEYLVIFDPQVFTFALLLSKVIIQAMPIISTENDNITFSLQDEDLLKNMKENPEILQRFWEVISAYLLVGTPEAAPPYIPAYIPMMAASILRSSMELFIMGHEYGHIIRGHLSQRKTAAALLGDEEVDEIIRSWEQEFEADAIGASLMINAMQREHRMDIALSFWGADLFFSCIDVIERGVSVLKTGKEPTNQETLSKSHPPVQLRREYLRAALQRSLSEKEALSPIQLGKELERIVDTLFTATQPALERLHQRGVKPALIWR